MNNPKITMMSYRDGKLSGKVVLNGHEWVVRPFKFPFAASSTCKEDELIKQAIRSIEK